jgi:hypothetical protein
MPQSLQPEALAYERLHPTVGQQPFKDQSRALIGSSGEIAAPRPFSRQYPLDLQRKGVKIS